VAVVVEMTSDEKKLLDGLRKLREEQEKLQEGWVKTGQVSKRSGESMGDALTGAVIKADLVRRGIDMLVSGFQEAENRAKASAAHIREMVDGIKELAALSPTTGALESRKASVAEIVATRGADQGVAQQFVGALTRTGAGEQEIRQSAQLFDVYANPTETAVAIRKFRGQFGGRALGGTFTSAAGMLGIAGGRAGMDPGAMADLAMEPARFGAELGIAPEETLAAIATAARFTSTPQEAASQVESFYKGLISDPRGRFRGLGLEGAVGRFGGLSPTAQRKLLGGAGAGGGQRLLGARFFEGHMPDILAMRGELGAEAAQPQFLARRLAVAEADPNIAAENAAARAAGMKGIAEMRGGQRELLEAAARDLIMADAAQRGKGWFKTGALDWMMAAYERQADIFGWSPREFASTLANFYGGFQGPSGERPLIEFWKRMEPGLRAFEQGAQRMQEGAKRMQGGPTLRHPDEDK